MNWKILLVILLVMSGAGFYLAREMDLFKKPDEEPVKIEKLISFDIDAVDRTTISFMDTAYVLERNFDEWRILEPYSGENADTLTVNNMLRTLTRINVIRKIPLDSINLAQVNLDKPVLSLEMHFKDGSSRGVNFGALNPTTENIYVHITGADTVIMIGRTLGASLAVNGRMIRSKQLINLPVLRVASFELERNGQTDRFAVDRQTGQWWVESPGPRRLVNKLVILTVLERFHQGEVREFYPPDHAGSAVTGLDKPVRRLIVEDLDGGRNEIRLGKSDQEREYLMWASSTVYPSEIVLVDSALVGQLDRLRPESIPYTRLSRLNIFSIDRMHFKYRDAELELKADSDTLWRLTLPQEHKARLWQVEKILAHVDTMNAVTLLPQKAPEHSFDDPQIDLTLYSGDSLIGHYQIGDYAGSDIYFRDVLNTADYTVAQRTLELLSWKYDDLADVQVRHVVR